MALVGGGLTVWGSIQIADHGGDLSAHVAAVCCGLALMAISIGLAGRACSKFLGLLSVPTDKLSLMLIRLIS